MLGRAEGTYFEPGQALDETFVFRADKDQAQTENFLGQAFFKFFFRDGSKVRLLNYFFI